MLKPLALAVGLILGSSAAFAEVVPGVQSGALTLNELQSMHYSAGMAMAGEDDVTNKRMQAMRDAAMASGAQHAYVQTMNQLRRQFQAEAKWLDEMWAFKDLMRLATPGEKSLYFLPAVIVEADDVTSHSDDNNRILVSGKYYQIVKRERLVTNPPDWREYLMIDQPVDVSKPVGALLPKTPEEQQAWSDWASEGWEAGILQANAEMVARTRNLGTDFIGMVKYLRLVKNKQLTPSYVASQYRNKVNQGSNLHINQRTFAITAPAAFNGNERDWVPLDLDPRAGYRTPDEVRAINNGQ
ncbi:type IV secretory system conjugative DNA transfer family protein (plasmid) [Pseudomonas silesiensis]|uniref:type IV secretory system conjugative DNA transfer family protein n=1 Tax=Pseudomonas silesiensis TaxID=1853130 RepID=UPI0030D3DE92